MDKGNYLKRFVSGTFFVFLFGILGAFLGYLLRFTLTRNLTPADYGLFYSCLSLVGLFALFKDFGLSGSLVYHISKFKSDKRLKWLKSSIYIVFLIQLIFSLIIAVTLFLSSNFLAVNYLRLSEISKGVIILELLAIVYFVQVGLAIISSVFQGFQKMTFLTISDFFRILFWFVLTYFFILLNFSVLAPAVALLISYMLTGIIFWPFASRLIPKVKFSFDRKLTKKLILYGFPIMLSSAAGLIIGSTDTILITIFRNLEMVGIYQTAQPTARLLWFFSGALATVLFPLVTELKTKKDKRLEKGVSLIYRYIWIILVPFALISFSFSAEILNLFFGSFYAQGSLVLKILSIGAIFYSIAQINGVTLNGIGKPQNFTKIVYLGAGVNLIGNLLLIPIIGIVGAAISTLLTYGVMFLFSFTELKKFVKVKVPTIEWIKTVICGLISLSVIYLLKSIIVANVFIEVFICFIISISVFLGLLVLLKVINVKEVIDLINQIIKK